MKKQLSIGFLIGLLANALGIVGYVLLFSKEGLGESIRQSLRSDFFGTLIAAGAILNFLPFFYFIKRNEIYRARGVLLATILAALGVAFLKLF